MEQRPQMLLSSPASSAEAAVIYIYIAALQPSGGRREGRRKRGEEGDAMPSCPSTCGAAADEEFHLLQLLCCAAGKVKHFE